MWLKTSLGLLFALAINFSSSGQPINNEQDKKAVGRIVRNASRLNCFTNRKKYQYVSIHWYEITNVPKEGVTDAEFINLLSGPIQERKDLPLIYLIGYETPEKVVFSSEGTRVFCEYKPTFRSDLVKYVLEKKPSSVFCLSGTRVNTFFMNFDGIVKVVRFSGHEHNLIEYSLSEYQRCCRDDLFLDLSR
jgi:hypothetical protein